MRAILTLDAGRPGWHRSQHHPPLLAGLVAPGTTKWALPPLDLARIECIRGPNLYIVGVEEVIQYGRNVQTYKQAWWCRLVLDSTALPAAMAGQPSPRPKALAL